jgi:hypothetical protein
MSELTPTLTTRTALHTIAAHVLGRRRFAVAGRFGLRAGPGGIATPAFGDDPETIRVSGVTLVREVGGLSTRVSINGSTLRDLADFVEADLDAPFSCGADTPALGPVDVPFDLVVATATEISDWFALGWTVLDDVLGTLPPGSEATTIQLWPEHFDAATTVTVPSGQPVNLGFSPGDGFESEPYLYVGPTGAERPGDPTFWNAPFGAVRRRSQTKGSPNTPEFCRQFLRQGLDLASLS